MTNANNQENDEGAFEKKWKRQTTLWVKNKFSHYILVDPVIYDLPNICPKTVYKFLHCCFEIKQISSYEYLIKFKILLITINSKYFIVPSVSYFEIIFAMAYRLRFHQICISSTIKKLI